MTLSELTQEGERLIRQLDRSVAEVMKRRAELIRFAKTGGPNAPR
jgi:uncharacterized protein with von Willebrand factor type A (vWA) domain